MFCTGLRQHGQLLNQFRHPDDPQSAMWMLTAAASFECWPVLVLALDIFGAAFGQDLHEMAPERGWPRAFEVGSYVIGVALVSAGLIFTLRGRTARAKVLQARSQHHAHARALPLHHYACRICSASKYW